MASKNVTVTMDRERETKNTVRFSAGTEDAPEALETIYVPKDTLAELGNPDAAKITVSLALA